MKRDFGDRCGKSPLKAILLSFLIIFICATAFCGCVSAEESEEPFFILDTIRDNIPLGSDVMISGIAKGNPEKVNIWFFGSNKFVYDNATVTDDKFEYKLDIKDYPIGHYILVVQHPMGDKLFNIQYNESLKKVISIPTGYDGKLEWDKMTQLLSHDQLQAENAADDLMSQIDSSGHDDLYVTQDFVIEEPYLKMFKCSDIVKGSNFTVLGRTNIDAEITVTVSLIKPDSSGNLQEEQVILTTKTNRCFPYHDDWSVTFNSDNLEISDYNVKAEIDYGGKTYVSEDHFKVVESINPAYIFSGGSGTKEDPYKISNADNLENLSYSVNIGNNYSKKYFIVTNDIDLSSVCNESSGVSWIPIGQYSVSRHDIEFLGNFDGGGHTISNLYIDTTSDSNKADDYYDYLGLFGFTRNASFKNLKLSNVNITGKNYHPDSSGVISIGGLVGACVDNNTIDNCEVSGRVRCVYHAYLGGLTGCLGGGTITNCCAEADVSEIYDDTYNVNIRHPPVGLVGGLVGLSTVGKITNSYTTGEVVGCACTGGLVGGNMYLGTITNCYATGDVNGSVFVGGLVGVVWFNNADEYKNTEMAITNCYATGTVSRGINSEYVDSYIYTQFGGFSVGGLVGLNYLPESQHLITITNCYASGDVRVINSDDDNYHVGGLVGFNNISRESKLTITNSAALNRYVNGTSNDVGRIVGYSYNNNGDTITLNNNYAWEGMKNGDNLITGDRNLNNKNGADVSDKSVWCNKTFYKTILNWDFVNTWTIDEIDKGTNYPLPYITSLGKEDSSRGNVIHLRPIFIVTFDNNSGDGTIDAQQFPSGDTQKLSPNTFTKDGFEFGGWAVNNPNGAAEYENNQSISIDENTTLYAVWNKILEPDNNAEIHKNESGAYDLNISKGNVTLIDTHIEIDQGVVNVTVNFKDVKEYHNENANYRNFTGHISDIKAKYHELVVNNTTDYELQTAVNISMELNDSTAIAKLPKITQGVNKTKSNWLKNKYRNSNLKIISMIGGKSEINKHIPKMTLEFKVNKNWVDLNGGKGNLKLFHISDDGTITEINAITIVDDESGINYKIIFESKYGFSEYVLGNMITKPAQSGDSPTADYDEQYSSDDDDDDWMSTTTTTPTVKPTQKPSEVPTETPTVTPTKEPTAKPTQTQTPMPIVGLLMGLGAAVLVLRRK